MFIKEISDPRLSGVSITDVQVDRELAYANIYVSAVEGNERSKEILDALKHAQGYLRRELSHRIELRTFPRLRFRWDPSLERAEKIDRLIALLHQEDSSEEVQTETQHSTESNDEDNEVDLNE